MNISKKDYSVHGIDVEVYSMTGACGGVNIIKLSVRFFYGSTYSKFSRVKSSRASKTCSFAFDEGCGEIIRR